MKRSLLCLCLFWHAVLFSQPILNLDYFFQEGQHEYLSYSVENEVLNIEGADVIWDFSDLNKEQASYSIRYSLKSLDENSQKILSKVDGKTRIYDDMLMIDTAVHLLYRYYDDCPIVLHSDNKIETPHIVFSTELMFEDSMKEVIKFLHNRPKQDTLVTQNSFIYSGYGSFIHPNGITYCDVIKVKRIAPDDNGQLMTTIGWYSKEAKSPLALITERMNTHSEKSKVEIREIDFYSINEQSLRLDSIFIEHSINNCDFRVNFFTSSACQYFNYDEVFIDYNNDGKIEDMSSINILSSHDKFFQIGAHKLLFKDTSTDEIREKILCVVDRKGPFLAGYGACLDDYPIFYIPADSSSRLITATDLLHGVTDNLCGGKVSIRMWLEVMSKDSFPRPDTLTREQIQTLLPSSYRIDCLEQTESLQSGIIYSFDEAGNWTSESVDFVIVSECDYFCPVDTITKFSFKDINGQPFKKEDGFLPRKLVLKDSLYQTRNCPHPWINDFELSIWQYSANFTEGVSVFDLMLIQKHILGIQPFSTFAQFAAADVDFSGEITAFDLLLIRKIILGIERTFPNYSNWVFYDYKENLLTKHPNVEVLPIHLIEEKRFQLIDTTYQILGVKLGDVNY